MRPKGRKIERMVPFNLVPGPIPMIYGVILRPVHLRHWTIDPTALCLNEFWGISPSALSLFPRGSLRWLDVEGCWSCSFREVFFHSYRVQTIVDVNYQWVNECIRNITLKARDYGADKASSKCPRCTDIMLDLWLTKVVVNQRIVTANVCEEFCTYITRSLMPWNKSVVSLVAAKYFHRKKTSQHNSRLIGWLAEC